jgi:hypothetical protein
VAGGSSSLNASSGSDLDVAGWIELSELDVKIDRRSRVTLPTHSEIAFHLGRSTDLRFSLKSRKLCA